MSQRNGRQICELVFNKTQIDWKNWQSAGYTWAFSRSHGLLSLSCLVAHHTQFWVALFRYRNACKNELTNLKIVEMKKQLPKWRMKSYGIVLFRNLTSLSFSSVSRNMSTSPYSICMKDELHLRNIFANLNIKCKNVCSQVSALPTIIVFRLK